MPIDDTDETTNPRARLEPDDFDEVIITEQRTLSEDVRRRLQLAASVRRIVDERARRGGGGS